MTPESTNLTPITYTEAMNLYTNNGRRPFSFVAAPHLVLKTVTVSRGCVVASPPDAVRAYYERLAMTVRAYHERPAKRRQRR